MKLISVRGDLIYLSFRALARNLIALVPSGTLKYKIFHFAEKGKAELFTKGEVEWGKGPVGLFVGEQVQCDFAHWTGYDMELGIEVSHGVLP